MARLHVYIYARISYTHIILIATIAPHRYIHTCILDLDISVQNQQMQNKQNRARVHLADAKTQGRPIHPKPKNLNS